MIDVLLYRGLAYRSGISDSEAYAALPGDEVAYLGVMAVQPAQHLVYYSIRHPWHGKPVDPTDEAALRAREDELRSGGLYLEFSWAFVLRPVDAGRTGLLLRARTNVAPMRLAGPLGIPYGLVDVCEGGGMLRGTRARAIAGSVSS